MKPDNPPLTILVSQILIQVVCPDVLVKCSETVGNGQLLLERRVKLFMGLPLKDSLLLSDSLRPGFHTENTATLMKSVSIENAF